MTVAKSPSDGDGGRRGATFSMPRTTGSSGRQRQAAAVAVCNSGRQRQCATAAGSGSVQWAAVGLTGRAGLDVSRPVVVLGRSDGHGPAEDAGGAERPPLVAAGVVVT